MKSSLLNKHRSLEILLLGATIISLLPGSRLQEVSRMLPIFRDTVKLLKESIPQLLPVIHVAPNQHVENYTDQAVQRWSMPVVLIPGGKTQLKYDAFSVRFSLSSLCLCYTVKSSKMCSAS